MVVDEFKMNLIILLCLTHAVWADNVDFYHELSMEEFTMAVNGTNFGFSTTYDRYNKRLIISAPTENNIGEVYDCDIPTHSCTKIAYDIKRILPNYKHNFWLGATVRAGSTFVVACAPAYSGLLNEYFGMYGHCYKRVKAEKRFSVEIKPSAMVSSKLGPIELDFETLGWDMDIGADDSIIVGGPAMFRKRVVLPKRMYVQTESTITAKIFCIFTYDGSEEVYAFRVRGLAAVLPPKSKGSSLLRINEVKAAFNFGYSVATGNFFNDETSYAVGSTYGTKGAGDVYFYAYDSNRLYNSDWVGPAMLQKEVETGIVGSMFGAVLCAANLSNKNKRKLTDLLVGAPAYAAKSGFNAGAVYVYVHKKKRNPPKYKRSIIGQKDGSFFGSAIINLADINGDGIDDVAIGAPYEDDGAGAVYLYSGAALNSDATEKSLTWLQRLQPTGHRSFGFSLAMLQDHDDNGCNELAVGAPNDGRVSLYRCMAAVTITGVSAVFPNLQDRSRSGKTDFVFHVCLDVQYPPKPQEIVAELTTDVEIHHLQAKLIHSTNGIFTFRTSLRDKQLRYCKNVDITLPVDGDYGMEIGYEITTKLLNSPVLIKNFESPRVILSDVSKLTHTGSVWAAECKGDRECISILDLGIKPISYPFIIGSQDKGTLNVVVSNTGEVAYDPCILVQVSGATLYQPPMDCSKLPELTNIWECVPRKPLRTNVNWVINEFILDLTQLTSRDTNVTFDVTLYNSCKDKKLNQTYKHFIPLKSSTEQLDIKGTTNFGDIVNMTKNDLLVYGKQLEHIYTIVNNGPTNFVDLTTEVHIQKNKFINYASIPVTFHTEGTSQTRQANKDCEVVSLDDVKLTLLCWIDSLPKQHYVKIVASMNVIPGSEIFESVQKENVTVNSSIVLQWYTYNITTQRVSTLLKLHEAVVDLWILILAGIVGLCLIVILALILYECGFLRRKNKADLEKLKNSVKRQTIRRSMMQQPQNDDHLKILERMDEVDEAAVDVPGHK